MLKPPRRENGQTHWLFIGFPLVLATALIPEGAAVGDGLTSGLLFSWLAVGAAINFSVLRERRSDPR